MRNTRDSHRHADLAAELGGISARAARQRKAASRQL